MIVFIFLLCFIASTIGGICGIGGGVVIKPLLDATDIMSVPTASFLSGITVLSMACINVWKNRKRNELELSRSLPLGVGAAIGGIVGNQVFSLLKDTVQADHIVGAVQAITLAVLVLGTLIYVLFKSRIRSKDIQGWFVPVVIGLLLGFCRYRRRTDEFSGTILLFLYGYQESGGQLHFNYFNQPSSQFDHDPGNMDSPGF